MVANIERGLIISDGEYVSDFNPKAIEYTGREGPAGEASSPESRGQKTEGCSIEVLSECVGAVSDSKRIQGTATRSDSAADTDAKRGIGKISYLRLPTLWGPIGGGGYNGQKSACSETESEFVSYSEAVLMLFLMRPRESDPRMGC